MTTQKFMGRNQLIDRLAAQIGDRGKALEVLAKRGHYDFKTGGLTSDGERRNQMTAEERALDRAAKRSGKPKTAYKYDPRTNRAKLKGF